MKLFCAILVIATIAALLDRQRIDDPNEIGLATSRARVPALRHRSVRETGFPEGAGRLEPDPQEIAAAKAGGRLALVFRGRSGLPVSDVRARLLGVDGQDGVPRTETSDEEGVASFDRLVPGRYRWRLLGSHAVDPVPPHEVGVAEKIRGGHRIRRDNVGLSGIFSVEDGQALVHQCLVSLPGSVSGRLVLPGHDLEGGRALVKLMTREIHDPAGDSPIDMILARRVHEFDGSRFAFDGVRPGRIELLVRSVDSDDVTRFLRHEFRLEPEERCDLGDLHLVRGLQTEIRFRIVDDENRSLDVTGSRLIMIEPVEPDPSWPYFPIRVGVDRPLHVGGLDERPWRLSVLSRENLPGRVNVGPRAHLFHADPEVELMERCLERRALELEVIPPPGTEGCDLLVFAAGRTTGAEFRRRLSGASDSSLRWKLLCAGETVDVVIVGRVAGMGEPVAARVTVEAATRNVVVPIERATGELREISCVGDRAEIRRIGPTDLAERGHWLHAIELEPGERREVVVPRGRIRVADGRAEPGGR